MTILRMDCVTVGTLLLILGCDDSRTTTSDRSRNGAIYLICLFATVFSAIIE